jgi:hypothetical protein
VVRPVDRAPRGSPIPLAPGARALVMLGFVLLNKAFEYAGLALSTPSTWRC